MLERLYALFRLAPFGAPRLRAVRKEQKHYHLDWSVIPSDAARRRPVLLVECKGSDTPVDRGLRYLKTRFPEADAWQISATGRKDYETPEGIRVAPALALLSSLV